MRSSKCNRCGRVLKNPVYIELGYGKVCAAKMGISVSSKKRAGDAEEPARKQDPQVLSWLKEKGCDFNETTLAET